MDLIERQAAIDAYAELTSSMSVCISVDECRGMKRMQGMAVRALEGLPAAPPERKTGKLIYESAYNWFRCNVCKKIYPSEFMQYFDSCQYQPRFNFCPHCGADMRGEQDGDD